MTRAQLLEQNARLRVQLSKSEHLAPKSFLGLAPKHPVDKLLMLLHIHKAYRLQLTNLHQTRHVKGRISKTFIPTMSGAETMAGYPKPAKRLSINFSLIDVEDGETIPTIPTTHSLPKPF